MASAFIKNVCKFSYRRCLGVRLYVSMAENQLHTLEKKLKTKDMNVSIGTELEHLKSIDLQWASKLNGQKLLSSVMHILLSQRKYKDLHLIVEYLKSMNYDMWSGMSTVVLKNYIGLNLWDDVIQHFEGMKSKDQVKHLRLYKELVTALACNNRIKEAWQYFEEMCEMELTIDTSRLKQPDFNMIFDLLYALMNTENSKQCVKLCTDHVYKSQSSLEEVDYSVQLMNSILDYLESWDIPLPKYVLDLLLHWFEMQEEFRVTKVAMNNAKCGNCSKDLTSNDSFKNLCEKIVESFETSHLSTFKELQYLHNLIDCNESFHILIDAGNMLYHGSRKNEKRLSTNLLQTTLGNLHQYCAKSFFNVALVLPQSLSKAAKLREFDFIDDIKKRNIFQYNLNVVTARNINDDLILCYLAAKSELALNEKGKKPVIISNDNFYNNKSIVDKEHRRLFFRWLRQRKVWGVLEGDFGDEVHCKALIREDNAIHLIGRGGSAFCIQKN